MKNMKEGGSREVKGKEKNYMCRRSRGSELILKSEHTQL